MEQVKKYSRLLLLDLLWGVKCVGIGFSVGTLATLIVCTFLESEDGFGMMGTLGALIGILTALLVRRNLNGHTRLHLAVAMGESRRGYLFWDTLLYALEASILFTVAWGLSHLEEWIYRLILPGRENLFDMGVIFEPRYAVFIIAAFVVMNLFWTAIMNRFGLKGFYITWFPIWLLCMVLGPAMDAYDAGARSVLAAIGAVITWVIDLLSFVPWQTLVTIPCIVLAAVSVLMLRKADIKL